MNTPLGVQGAAHQKRRDQQEAAFRKLYGADTASTTIAKVRATKMVSAAITGIKERAARVKAVNDILRASGRSATFAS